MIVWLNTLPGQFLHDFTYKIILITGVAVVVMNLNPLLKLDGYYFLTELIGLPDLKEHSTAFATSWIQRWVLRLPVEVMVVPRRRILLFAVYATLSGAYSYAMLFFALRFVYNMTSKLLAEFALFPVSWLAVVMFRSRLKSLAGLLRKMWASNFVTGFRPSPLAIAIAVALLLLIFVPIFREREDAYFLVEPSHPVTLHANVTGTIDAVYVREGETVHAGDPLLRMTSGYAASLNSNAQAARGAAHYAVFAAQMAGHSVGSAAADDEAARRAMLLAGEAQASLTIRATEDGRILTRDPDSLLYRRVAAGQPLIEFAGDEKNGQTSAAHPGEYVRLFVPAKALPHIQPGDEVALAPPGLFSIVRLRLTPLDGEAVPLPAGMIVHQDYRGIELPSFYCARLSLPDKSPGFLLGTAGVARIFGPRRSLAHSFLMVILNLIHAHVW
jgi:putative peptide zinc metalloprotease protein